MFFKYACVMQRYVTLRCITLRSGDSLGRQQHFLYCGPCHHGAFVCTGATGAVEGARRSHWSHAATSCKASGGCLSAVTRTKRESLLSAQARQVPRSSPSTCPESEARHASGQQPGTGVEKPTCAPCRAGTAWSASQTYSCWWREKGAKWLS